MDEPFRSWFFYNIYLFISIVIVRDLIDDGPLMSPKWSSPDGGFSRGRQAPCSHN